MTNTTTENHDQYDTLLRAMDEGLLISVNNEASQATPSDELRVEHSRDNETKVTLSGAFGSNWQIYRDRDDYLIYSEVNDDGLAFVDEVITIEVIGLD